MSRESQNKSWGLHLNTGGWARDKDWPKWTNRLQRNKWREKGLIVWDSQTKTVARLRAKHALDVLAELRDGSAWRQEGCVVGEQAWVLSDNDPDGKGKQILSDQIELDAEQAAALLEVLLQEEVVLRQMMEVDTAEMWRALDKVYDLLIRLGERGKHTIYDESLSWEENKQIMRERRESGEVPEKLTWTERKLYAEVRKEFIDELEQKHLRSQRRARTVKKNLLNYHYFWERLKGHWPHLRPDERLHILQLLQDREWNERTLAEVRQIFENAEFFTTLAVKRGVVEGPYMISSEELDLILDLSDQALWDELIALYPRRPDAPPEVDAGETEGT